MRQTVIFLMHFFPGTFGISNFVPVSFLEEGGFENQSSSTSGGQGVGRLRRKLQPSECPPDFSGGNACDQPLDTCEKWQACAVQCQPASCCSETCQTSCLSCRTYSPCQILGQSGSPCEQTDTCSVLSVDYFQGFNVNFNIGSEEAESLMPFSWFTPMQIQEVESLSERKRSERKRSERKRTKAKKGKDDKNSYNENDYLVSLYVAKIGVEFGGLQVQVGRADLFTYATDSDGEESLVILGVIMEVPNAFQSDTTALEAYKEAIENLALDSRSGKPAYPHKYAFEFKLDDDGFVISGGDLDEKFEVETFCNGISVSFTREFVLANSQAYRSPIDKNVNFFNKDFINAVVQDVPTDAKCSKVKGIDSLLLLIDLLPSQAELKSIQRYGSQEKPITWHYEDSTDSVGTPYLTLAEKRERIAFKQLAFGNIWNERAEAIASGDAEFILKLNARDYFFVNWEISEQGAVDLSQDLGLDSLGLSMVPVQILANDSERFLLSLNAYHATFEQLPEETGARSGIRFEFSIYVQSEDSPRPSFMVVEAFSSISSFDPVNGEVDPSDILFSRDANTLSVSSRIEGVDWAAEFVLDASEKVRANKNWIMANDVIYWSNGIADQTFYDNKVTAQHPVTATLTSLSGSSTWEQYIVDMLSPVHAFFYEEALEFCIVPWFNLNDVSLGSPELEASLKQTKASVYRGLAQLTGALVGVGLQEPLIDLVAFGKYPDTPKLLLNFEIPVQNVKELEKVIGLHDEYQIAQMKMTENSKSKYMMTVEVFTTSLAFGGSLFIEAVWSTYVEDNDGQVILNNFHVETSSELGGFDVVEILKPAAEVFTVTVDDDMLMIVVKNGDFLATFNVPMVATEDKIDLADEWVYSHDKILWKKGVYDETFYNGELWRAKVMPVSSKSVKVTQETPWTKLVSKSPFEVYFFDSDSMFVSNPWYNIEEV